MRSVAPSPRCERSLFFARSPSVRGPSAPGGGPSHCVRANTRRRSAASFRRRSLDPTETNAGAMMSRPSTGGQGTARQRACRRPGLTPLSPVAGAGATATTHRHRRRGTRAGRRRRADRGEHRQQPGHLGVTCRARRRGIGLAHRPTQLEAIVAGAAAVLVAGHPPKLGDVRMTGRGLPSAGGTRHAPSTGVVRRPPAPSVASTAGWLRLAGRTTSR